MRVSPDFPTFSATLLRSEFARIVAEHYLDGGEWTTAKARILATNALQCDSTASAIRIEGELRRRLQPLTEAQLRLLFARHERAASDLRQHLNTRSPVILRAQRCETRVQRHEPRSVLPCETQQDCVRHLAMTAQSIGGHGFEREGLVC